ncbi:MAG: precorrin-4 C(11)-methyltransferase [Lachnospiraceae bacterium]|nr:precorrin-4 C(11)-methyltransferase [Lachnospiraceae bacterium]
MVHFVGAGPGAVDLITVRGMELLKKADVVIYAGSLVNPALLEYVKPGCGIYNSAYMDLEEVIEVIKNSKGEVIRLHTGDPSLFGAVKEQMDILDKEGIEYDVVPGVSSMFAAAAALKAEYTLPGLSQSVIITRAEGRTKVPKGQELSSMAAHNATLVLFLSSGMAGKVSDELQEGGYSKDTAVAVVYKASWPEEQIIRTTVGSLKEDMESAGIFKTALIIVGDVLDHEYEYSKLYDKNFTTGYRAGKDRS